MEKIIMPYRQYKSRYADCETVRGSYDADSKTITVLVPDGRMKPSGTRGQRYMWLIYKGIERATNREISVTIKATTRENAEKQLARYYPDCEFAL